MDEFESEKLLDPKRQQEELTINRIEIAQDIEREIIDIFDRSESALGEEISEKLDQLKTEDVTEEMVSTIARMCFDILNEDYTETIPLSDFSHTIEDTVKRILRGLVKANQGHLPKL
jgi:hypothetical protein